MKIARVQALALKIPRDLGAATGTAGSPARLMESGSSPYRWAEHYRTVYSTGIETTLIRVETDEGLVGWGEAQAPVAPEIARTVVDSLLAGLVVGEDALAPEALWDRMYAAMRVRGHTGGFLLDAMAGIDIAVWDLCGKAYGQPVYRLLGGPVRERLPYYVSGIPGDTAEERIAYARGFVERGARAFKLFLHSTEGELLDQVDGLRAAFGAEIDIYVDALWRLRPKSALRLASALEARGVGWLEAPLMPEDVRGHQRLARATRVAIAIGESYRTRYELLPFFQAGAVDVVQPDLGRSGITEARKVAAVAEAFQLLVSPHVSIGLGPQIAAALQFGAACPNLGLLECNPRVYEVANRFLRTPIEMGTATLPVPQGSGLGIEVDEEAVLEYRV